MSFIPVEKQKKLLAQAIRFTKKGEPQKAVNILEKLVKDAPEMPEAHFHFARLAIQNKAPILGMHHLKIARLLDPTIFAIWKLSARVTLGFGKEQDIEEIKKDLRNAPLSVQEKKSLFSAMAHVSHGGFGGAPKHEVDEMISALTSSNFIKANEIAARLNDQYPKSGHILNALAASHEGLGDVESADAYFCRAVFLEPRAPSILINYTRFLSAFGRWHEALLYGEKALELRPEENRIKAILSRIYVRFDEPSKALKMANDALAAGFGGRDVVIAKAQALADLVGSEAGLEIYDTFIAQTGDELIKLNRGNLYQEVGNFEAAQSDYLDAIVADPLNGEGYFQVSVVNKFELDQPLIAQFETASKDERLTNRSKIAVNFGLAKAYEDTKQYEKVFGPLNLANSLVHSSGRWSESNYINRQTRTHAVARAVDLVAIGAESSVSYDPIFVTGLPRSGTTLTEQILSSHSTRIGVGEAMWSGRYFLPVLVENDETPSARKRILQAGQSYEEAACELHSADQGIVDKALQNHERIGFIKAALPKSKIVVLKRDPRDNLLSVYKNRFPPNSMSFNSDFRSLAFTYSLFLKYLEFWEQTVPGSFYTLDYDELTANPEDETRKLLAFCELEWEDGVLDHGKNESSIKTLSSYQARQPIYRSSVRSWEKYADELKPMIDALKEFGVPLPD